jgi:hypothetical protein
MMSLVGLKFASGTHPKVQSSISERVRDLFPTQKWTSSFCYSFFNGSDSNKDDIRSYCGALQKFFTGIASDSYLRDCASEASVFAAITERSESAVPKNDLNLAYEVVNCSDLKAVFGSFYEDFKLVEHNLASVCIDYLFANYKSPAAARAATVSNMNSFNSLGATPALSLGMIANLECYVILIVRKTFSQER